MKLVKTEDSVGVALGKNDLVYVKIAKEHVYPNTNFGTVPATFSFEPTFPEMADGDVVYSLQVLNRHRAKSITLTRLEEEIL